MRKGDYFPRVLAAEPLLAESAADFAYAERKMHPTRCTRRDRALVIVGGICVICIVVWRTLAMPPLYPLRPLLDLTFDNFSVAQIATFDTSMAKLTVIDIATRDPFHKLTIRRRMLNMERNEIFVSEVELAIPEKLPDGPVNSSLFSVDRTKLNPASRPLVSPPFATGSLSRQRDAPSKVLIVGLGGSQMNNYLHYTFPKMDVTVVELEPTMVEIARQYFGLKEDDGQRVLVMDGQDYLREAASKGMKFDAIYIDACPTRFPYDEEVLCPIYIFLNQTVIGYMKDSLADTGTLAVKTLLFSSDVEAKADGIAQHYRQKFKNCAVMPMLSDLNRVLVCTGDAVEKQRLQKDTFMAETAKFYGEFGLTEGPVFPMQ